MISHFRHKVPWILTLLILCWLPITRINILWPLLLLFLIQITQKKTYDKFKVIYKHPPFRSFFISMIVFVVINFISLLYTEHFDVGIKKAALLLLLPLSVFVFITPGMTGVQVEKTVYWSFLTGCFIATLISVIHGIKSAPGFDVFLAHHAHFLYYYHHSYFAMYLTFAIVLMLNYLRIYYNQSHNIEKFVFIILIIWFVLMIYLLSSRAGFAVLIFVLLMMILLVPLSSMLRKLRIAAVFSVILFALIMLYTNQKYRYYFIEPLTESISQGNDIGEVIQKRFLRIKLWGNSMKIIGNSFFTGVGIGDVQTELQKEYENANCDECLQTKLNAHNQYLESFMASGIISFISLVVMFVSAIRLFIQKKGIVGFLFLLIIIFNCFFESMLMRINGILYTGILLGVLISISFPDAVVENNE